MIKSIVNFEDRYLIDDRGYVFSLPKYGSGGHNGMFMKSRLDKDGYCILNLYKDSKLTTFKLHRLVAIHFLKNSKNLPEVNHKDGNKQNNHVNNLEWCTALYNRQDVWKRGKSFNPLHQKKGEESPNSKITEEMARNIIKERMSGDKLNKISNKYSLSMSQICAIAKGNSWKHLK